MQNLAKVTCMETAPPLALEHSIIYSCPQRCQPIDVLMELYVFPKSLFYLIPIKHVCKLSFFLPLKVASCCFASPCVVPASFLLLLHPARTNATTLYKEFALNQFPGNCRNTRYFNIYVNFQTLRFQTIDKSDKKKLLKRHKQVH